MASRVSITPIAGHFTATWDSDSLGQTEEGFQIRIIGGAEDVTADAGGISTLTRIWQGGNMFIDFVGLEYHKLLSAGLFYPVNTLHANGLPDNLTDAVGTNEYASYKPLVLTPVGGNASTPGGVITFLKTILVSEITVPLGSRFTRVPVTFQAFPDTGTNDDYFTWA